MGRISLTLAVALWVTALQVSAQSDGAFFEFIENKGQWDKEVQFRGELATGAFYLHNNGFTVNLYHPEDLRSVFNSHSHSNASGDKKKTKKIDYSRDLSGRVTDPNLTDPSQTVKTLRGHAYRVEFVGASLSAQPSPEKALNTYNNYLIGNDPSKWATGVKIYNVVLYKDVYPGIDVRYYSESGTLKYDLIVHPGSDPSKVLMRYHGVEKLTLKNNDLIIKTSVGEARELYPYSYQSDNVKGRQKVDCKFVVNGNLVRFQVGNYDKSKILIIDPTLIFASFTGSSGNQYGFTATPGPDGSLYSGGIVFEAGFPTTPGAYQTIKAGKECDIGIMKFSPNGTQRLYATYLGGAAHADYPHSLFCDRQGNLVVMGRSYSYDYPVTSTIGSPASNGYANIIVTKLNSTGTNIIGSLSIGGSRNDGVNIKDLQQTNSHGAESLVRNYGDDSRSEVVMDGAGYIYVAGQTHSSDFPVVNAFQPNPGGNQDGVVMKIDPNCRNLVWASYLGGSGDDGAFVLDINPATGDVYVAGATTSSDFPGNKSGTIGPAFNSGQDVNGTAPDGFVAVIRNNGNALLRSTFIGTNNVDIIYGLKFDRKGYPYIMGTTRGDWAPRGNPMPQEFGGSNNAQFVAKLEPDLSNYVYTTTFGSGSRPKKPNLSPVAFLVDRCENLYISGWGGWIDTKSNDPYDQAGVVGLPITGDAIKAQTDNNDFYFIVIEKNAQRLLYGTYFGQRGGRYGEHVDGGTSRYDQQGVIYQAMCANCYGGARFPTTPGVVGPVNGTGNDGCNLAAVKISFDFAGVAAGPRVYFNGVPDSVGCAPFTVELRDTLLLGKSYVWDFGDGSEEETTTNTSVMHTYEDVGRYTVRLIAIDPQSCNERDTAYATVIVGNDAAHLDMNIERIPPCDLMQYRFENRSTFTYQPFSDTSFIWDFGDGTRIRAGMAEATHIYTSPGTYTVRLIIDDTTYCNSPDSIEQVVRVNPRVVASFATPDKGCAPYDAVFENISLGGDTFIWDFGDGTVEVNNGLFVTHTYPNPGTYTIRLTARDESVCSMVDDTTLTITVYEKPTASFTYTPVTPQVNKPTIFENTSLNAVRFIWHFGDGDSVEKNNMDTVLHQYNITETFTPMLIAFNEAGCADTTVRQVRSLIDPLLDVPNAFTPGRFGKNSVVRVEGFGIVKMAWRIYSRQGQKVFETNDRKMGWDGTFNGRLLPMDVYTYTLDVQYFDGRTVRKTGDITLIR